MSAHRLPHTSRKFPRIPNPKKNIINSILDTPCQFLANVSINPHKPPFKYVRCNHKPTYISIPIFEENKNDNLMFCYGFIGVLCEIFQLRKKTPEITIFLIITNYITSSPPHTPPHTTPLHATLHTTPRPSHPTHKHKSIRTYYYNIIYCFASCITIQQSR